MPGLKFLPLLLFFTTSILLAQNTGKIDSLSRQLIQSSNDTNKVNIYGFLADEFTTSDPDSALKLAKLGNGLAVKLKYEKGKARCLNLMGVIYYNKGIYEKALGYYLQALKINEKIGNKNGLSTNLCNLGAVYRIQKRYKEGLDYQFKALKLNEETGNKAAIASDHTNIGNIYFDAENYSMAEAYYKKALKVFKDISDSENTATVLNNIGAISFNKGNYDKAEEFFKKAIELYETAGDKLGIAIDLNNLGQIYTDKKDYAKAMEYFKQSLVLAKEIDSKEIQQYNYESLAEIASKTKNYKDAYEYHKQYSSIAGNLLNAETSKQINELAIKYEAEKKEKENAFLKQVTTKQQFLNQRQKEIANYMGAGMVLVAGFGFIFFMRSRIRQKANKNLERIVRERTSELEFKNKQKELMLQEIHHRVKNNLQIISSILRMQRHFKGNKDVDEILNVCNDRIKCMAILHDKLYQAKNFNEINAKDYFTELSSYVSKNYDGNTKIELDLIPAHLNIDKLIPCGLILNELVSNAYKYAFNGAHNNSINISFSRNEETGVYQLRIKDNGKGLPHEFDINNQSGLGLTIVSSLVEQLDGTINFQNKKGVEVDICFPA